MLAEAIVQAMKEINDEFENDKPLYKTKNLEKIDATKRRRLEKVKQVITDLSDSLEITSYGVNSFKELGFVESERYYNQTKSQFFHLDIFLRNMKALKDKHLEKFGTSRIRLSFFATQIANIRKSMKQKLLELGQAIQVDEAKENRARISLSKSTLYGSSAKTISQNDSFNSASPKPSS